MWHHILAAASTIIIEYLLVSFSFDFIISIWSYKSGSDFPMVMVWGCIMKDSKGLLVVLEYPGRRGKGMNSDRYIKQVLKDQICYYYICMCKERGHVLFQQDEAPSQSQCRLDSNKTPFNFSCIHLLSPTSAQLNPFGKPSGPVQPGPVPGGMVLFDCMLLSGRALPHFARPSGASFHRELQGLPPDACLGRSSMNNASTTTMAIGLESTLLKSVTPLNVAPASVTIGHV